MSTEIPTKAQLVRLLQAFLAVGRPIQGARIRSDGSIELLSKFDEAPEAQEVDWVQLAGHCA
jgi:hypothetical protein